MTDLLLRGGTVADGTGNKPYPADIAITGETITAIGDLSQEHAGRTLDVSSHIVAPGFIDIHTHSDFSILVNRPMRSSLAQGVTTEVVGNCGVSVGLVQNTPAFEMERRWRIRDGVQLDWQSMAGFFARLEDGGMACNVLSLAGHGTIRKAVMGFDHRPPSPAELAQMQQMLSGAMDDGAVGFSTGLEYLPGGHADVAEQAALARIAADAGGFYATHIRNEGDTLVESVQEALDVAERAGIALQLSHHKSEGRANWGKVRATLSMMQAARDAGRDVLTDQYPYTAFMTGLAVILLPGWANEGSMEDTVARLRDSSTRARIAAEIDAHAWDWNTLQIGIARSRPDAEGLTLAQLGERDGKRPVDAALDLMQGEQGWVAAVHFAMSEEDVEAVLRDPHTMIGSDGVSNDPHSALAEGKTHPRTYGTFPRVLARYVRGREVISLQEAVRRMTSLPAQRLKLTDRGVLRVGMKADVAVFNPDTVADVATFDDPHRFPLGIPFVCVNGRVSVDNGVHTDALSGKVLRRV